MDTDNLSFLFSFFLSVFPASFLFSFFYSFSLTISLSACLCETDAPWTVLLANIDPESNSVLVGGLIPARSYQFRLCAVNDVGRGQFSRETER